VDAVLGVYCTLCRLYSVYAVLGVCCTWCMLYLVYAVLGVCCTQCQLMIMTWRNREGWLNFVFCDDSWVVDEKDRDGRWRWQRCEYERIWEIRGTTSLIGLGRPRMGVIRWRIGTYLCWIRDGKLTLTRNSLSASFSPVSFHLSLPCPQLDHHLTTRS